MAGTRFGVRFIRKNWSQMSRKKLAGIKRHEVRNVAPQFDELELLERVNAAMDRALNAPEFENVGDDFLAGKQLAFVKLAIEEALQATEYATYNQARSVEWDLQSAEQLSSAQKMSY